MTVTRIDFSPASFPAKIDLHVSDGVDFIFDMAFALDGEVVDFSQVVWTATFVIKKGIDYQDTEFSCDQTDYITLDTNPVGDRAISESTVNTVTGSSNKNKNIRVQIPASVSNAFSFESGVYAFELSDGTFNYRLCTGSVVMNRFTSVTAFSS